MIFDAGNARPYREAIIKTSSSPTVSTTKRERVTIRSPKMLEKNPTLINAGRKKVLHYQKPVDLFNFFLDKCCT